MTTSLWQDTFTIPDRPRLAEHLVTDVCVIGAGIAGLSVAYALAKAGKRVVVVDLAQIGSGETGRTTAHLASELDDRYETMEKARGLETSRLTYEAHAAAIDRIESIVRTERIDCDFARLDGYLFLGGDDTPALLDRELAAARRAGFAGAELVPRLPIRGDESGPAIRFPAQGRFHILRYLDGLARAIESAGGRIFGSTRVESIEGGTPAMVTTAGKFTVAADEVVVCTNGAISDMVVTHVKQAPYRTFVVAFRVPKGSVPDALYWDTLDPYHYVRIQPLDATHDALIVGGEDHKTAHEDDAGERFDCLVDWTREQFPVVATGGPEVGPIARWSGQVLETHDYTAFIGRNPDGAEHVWLATGDSGMGMTHGTIAGILLPALMATGTHPWQAVFDPKRVTLHRTELLGMAKENADVALQFADYITPGQVPDAAAVPAGEGRVIRRGVHKVAVYKGEDGTVHECSAVCTHMKCIVDWNTAEKSWDCPCHGSRFDRYGKVISGPATADLEKLERNS